MGSWERKRESPGESPRPGPEHGGHADGHVVRSPDSETLTPISQPCHQSVPQTPLTVAHDRCSGYSSRVCWSQPEAGHSPFIHRLG